MKNILRSCTILAVAALCAPWARAQQVGISANGAATTPSAILDLDVTSLATKKGLLVPRMTDAQRAAIPAPANGLIVYQTNTVSLTSPEGYWYYDGLAAAWVPVYNGPTPWVTTGNTGTTPATDYVGTNDAQHFTFRTNNVERMRVQNNAGSGRVGIGTLGVPNEVLELNGAMVVDGLAAADLAGNIQWKQQYAGPPAQYAHEGNINGMAGSAGWYPLENGFSKRVNQTYQTVTGSCNPFTNITAANFPGPGNGYTIGAGATTTVGTIETPYSTFWEDGRHQYLWLASELTAVGLCPNLNITGLAFNAVGNANIPQVNVEIKMKNTSTTSMATFDLTGLNLVYSSASFSAINGWNAHVFGAPFQWNGTANVIVEYCHNNYDWNGNVTVRADNTSGFAGLYGLYCDACGGTGTIPCTPTNPPNPGSGVGPCGGTGCPAPWNCCGYSMTPGCMLTTTSSLNTCDGSFQYTGAQASVNKRPQIRFAASYGSTTLTNTSGDYMYSSLPVMIGTSGWATGGVLPNQAFKGPGTLSAQVSVWGGTTLLSDYVFDQYYDGSVRPEDAQAAKGYAHLPISEMANYVERERHLPTIDGREQVVQQGMSVDRLTNQLWATVEDQALYIQELNARMDLLQKHLLQKRLKELDRKN